MTKNARHAFAMFGVSLVVVLMSLSMRGGRRREVVFTMLGLLLIHPAIWAMVSGGDCGYGKAFGALWFTQSLVLIFTGVVCHSRGRFLGALAAATALVGALATQSFDVEELLASPFASVKTFAPALLGVWLVATAPLRSRPGFTRRGLRFASWGLGSILAGLMVLGAFEAVGASKWGIEEGISLSEDRDLLREFSRAARR